MALLFKNFIPSLALQSSQFVNVPANLFSQIKLPDYHAVFEHSTIWKTGIVICLVATLETLLSVEAVDKLDPYSHREKLCQC